MAAMASPSGDDEDDDFFKEVYGKEYAGPLEGRDGKAGPKKAEKPQQGPWEESEGCEARDPNELPRDFASRESKLWDAKAKAVERNWKRRRDEEMNCRICGESGHFAQGCPSTLGGSARPGEHMHRMLLRDRRLKPRLIGTGGTVIQGLEKSSGCKIKLEDSLAAGDGSFTVQITGSNEDKVKKAMDAVTGLVKQVEEEWKQQQAGRKAASGAVGRGVLGAMPAGPPMGRAPAPRPFPASTFAEHTEVYAPPIISPVPEFPAMASLPAGSVAFVVDPDQQITEQIAAQLEARRRFERRETAQAGYGPGLAGVQGQGHSGTASGYSPRDGGFGSSAAATGPGQESQAASVQMYQQEHRRQGGGSYAEPLGSLSGLPPEASGQFYPHGLLGEQGGYRDPTPGMAHTAVLSTGVGGGGAGDPAGRGEAGYGQEGGRGESGGAAEEEDMEVGYGDGDGNAGGGGDGEPELGWAKTLAELEQRFLEQTMALTRAQTADETGELARHTQRMGEIREQYQRKMAALRTQQTSERDAFLIQRAQAQAQAHSSGAPMASAFQHAATARQPVSSEYQYPAASYAPPATSALAPAYQEAGGGKGYLASQVQQPPFGSTGTSPGIAGAGMGGTSADLASRAGLQAYGSESGTASMAGSLLTTSTASGLELAAALLSSFRAGEAVAPGGGVGVAGGSRTGQFLYDSDQRQGGSAGQGYTAEQNGASVENQGSYSVPYTQAPPTSQPAQQYSQSTTQLYGQSGSQAYGQAQVSSLNPSQGQGFNQTQATHVGYDQMQGRAYDQSQESNYSQSQAVYSQVPGSQAYGSSQSAPAGYSQSRAFTVGTSGASASYSSGQVGPLDAGQQATQAEAYANYSAIGGSYPSYR